MPIRLLPGQSRDHVLQVLQTQLNGLSNINGDANESLRRYLEWVTDARTQLRSIVVQREADRLVSSPAYDRLLHLFGVLDLEAPIQIERSRVINGLVHAEVAARKVTFESVIAALRLQIDRWTRPGKFVLCDTNFYLAGPVPLGDPGFVDVLGDHEHGVHIILPMVVVEELDRAKLGRDEFRGRAQLTLARLDALFANPTDIVQLGPKATVELLFDPPGHVRIADADSEIIDRALAVHGLAARPVTLVTHDTNMSMKSRVAGLDVLKLVAPERPPSTRQLRRDRLADAKPSSGHARQENSATA
jgi:hypothetical protein